MKKWIIENKGLFWLIGGCFIAFYLLLITTEWLFPDSKNTLVDYADVVNGLFSAFAFAGLIYTVFLQKNELELQRDELKQTREELEGQKKEFEQQNETLKRQRFENTFFNMLRLQQEIVSSLTYSFQESEVIGQDNKGLNIKKNVTRTIIGRTLFSDLYTNVNISYYIESDIYLDAKSLRSALCKEGLYEVYNENGKPRSDILNDYKKDGVDIFNIYELSDLPSYFDHYFRHMYRIIKFVDNSPLLTDTFEDRYQYVSIIRAQLSRYELVWLFYNCLSSYGERKFKPLIEKYSILKNIRFELLAKDEHKDLYEASAYGNR